MPRRPRKSGRASSRDARSRGGERKLSIVGIGASAGGLDAQLLQDLPGDLGLAVVLVQHLAPQPESALPTLLANVTRLGVAQVTEGMRAQPNWLHVIPPNARLTLADGELHLAPRATDRERSVAVVLSGTASDGASGVRDVKAAGGITIAQRPEGAPP